MHWPIYEIDPICGEEVHFVAISSTNSRGDEANAIDGNLNTVSYMTAYASPIGMQQTITARLPPSCAALGGVSWSTGRGASDLSVRFQILGHPVSAVVDKSDSKLLAKFTSSPGSSGWHLTAVNATGKSLSFTWPMVKTTELQLVFLVSGYVHWPIYEIDPLCGEEACPVVISKL